MNPEETIINRILAKLSTRQREALLRFYVLEQTSAEVSRGIGMEESELCDLKSRVKKEILAAKRQ